MKCNTRINIKIVEERVRLFLPVSVALLVYGNSDDGSSCYVITDVIVSLWSEFNHGDVICFFLFFVIILAGDTGGRT